MANEAKNLDIQFDTEKVAPELRVVASDEVPLEEQDEYHRYKNQKLHRTSEENESNWLVSYADMMTLLVGFFVMLLSFSKVDAAKYEQIKKATTKLFGGEYKVPFEKLTSKMKTAVESQGLKDQVLFSETDEGVEITFRGALFFDSGSVTLRSDALDLLHKLIPPIAQEAKGFSIEVEGHTDDVPLSHGHGGVVATNWELSSLRACTVIRIFEESGFDRSKLKPLGWADTKPLVPNKTPDGSSITANQAQNRRVVIRVLKGTEHL